MRVTGNEPAGEAEGHTASQGCGSYMAISEGMRLPCMRSVTSGDGVPITRQMRRSWSRSAEGGGSFQKEKKKKGKGRRESPRACLSLPLPFLPPLLSFFLAVFLLLLFLLPSHSHLPQKISACSMCKGSGEREKGRMHAQLAPGSRGLRLMSSARIHPADHTSTTREDMKGEGG